MFNLFSKKKNNPQGFLVNDHGNYKFAAMGDMPETQLVMLVPRKAWLRLPEYIANYEAVSLAGRFGAEPGDYEWEWVPGQDAVRWWRRSSTGEVSLFGMAVSVPRGDMMELYGLVEVDENSPHWAEVIPEEAANAMPNQARLSARTHGTGELGNLRNLYLEYFRGKKMLTQDKPGQPALRRGTIREVERFRDAVRALVDRASKVILPSESR
ncbi:MAG: hypothetical protein ABI847_08610 [Anaerolineales bacterium]